MDPFYSSQCVKLQTHWSGGELLKCNTFLSLVGSVLSVSLGLMIQVLTTPAGTAPHSEVWRWRDCAISTLAEGPSFRGPNQLFRHERQTDFSCFFIPHCASRCSPIPSLFRECVCNLPTMFMSCFLWKVGQLHEVVLLPLFTNVHIVLVLFLFYCPEEAA